MDIEKYMSFFHDGTIHHIKQKDTGVEILLESCEIHPECGVNVKLSARRTITGTLNLFDVNYIVINDVQVTQLKELREGELLRFNINDSTVELLVDWYDSPTQSNFIQQIVIKAPKIQWEYLDNAYVGAYF